MKIDTFSAPARQHPLRRYVMERKHPVPAPLGPGHVAFNDLGGQTSRRRVR